MEGGDHIKFIITLIKEKSSGLRIHFVFPMNEPLWQSCCDVINEIIGEAQQLADNSCEICAKKSTMKMCG